jgi:homoserine dehydrogenase
VLADLTEAALDVARGHQPLPLSSQNLFPKLLSMDAVISRSYLRLTVEDKPGVLAQVATILGVHGISISSVYQPEGVAEQSVPLVLLLNFAQENILQKAVHEIEQLAVVTQKAQLIRIGDL